VPKILLALDEPVGNYDGVLKMRSFIAHKFLRLADPESKMTNAKNSAHMTFEYEGDYSLSCEPIHVEEQEAPPQKVHITSSSINHGDSAKYSANTEEIHNQAWGQHGASSSRYKVEPQVSSNRNDGDPGYPRCVGAKISQEPPPPPPPLPKTKNYVCTENRDE